MTYTKEVWLLWFTIFFGKMFPGTGVANNEIKQNLKLVEELL